MKGATTTWFRLHGQQTVRPQLTLVLATQFANCFILKVMACIFSKRSSRLPNSFSTTMNREFAVFLMPASPPCHTHPDLSIRGSKLGKTTEIAQAGCVGRYSCRTKPIPPTLQEKGWLAAGWNRSEQRSQSCELHEQGVLIRCRWPCRMPSLARAPQATHHHRCGDGKMACCHQGPCASEADVLTLKVASWHKCHSLPLPKVLLST